MDMEDLANWVLPETKAQARGEAEKFITQKLKLKYI